MSKYCKLLETHFDSTADRNHSGFEGPIHTIGGKIYPLRRALQESAEMLGHRYNLVRGDPMGLGDIAQC